MPQSRKRHDHPYRKPADIPSSQRTNGKTIWALLFGAFGLLIGLFASGGNVVALVIGALAGALIGYFIGKNMEEEAAKK